MEIHYTILKAHGARASHEVLQAYSAKEIESSLPDLEAVMRLRYELRNLELSYADALGYYISKKERIKFLTGDRVFEGPPSVEFVR